MKTHLILAALFVTTTSGAGTPSTDASVRELFALTKVDSVVVRVLHENLRELAKNDAAQKAASVAMEVGFKWEDAELQALRKEASKKAAEIFDATTSIDMVTTELVRVYARSYSEEEIRAQIAFYSSPTGRKVVQLGDSFAWNNAMRIGRTREPELESKLASLGDELRASARALKAKNVQAKK